MPKKRSPLVYALIILPVKVFLFLVRIAIFAGLTIVAWYILQTLGIFSVSVPVSGSSMLPTLPEQGRVNFQRFFYNETLQKIFPQTIKKGDLVVFENKKTDEVLAKNKEKATGFVKRVIGVPGDVVEIKDGFTYINGNKITEEYINKPRSTFGGTQYRDCQQIKIPKDKLFVLGDNRKVSMDSRQIGLVDIKDILYYIPFERQENRFGNKWRDATHDFDTQLESLFDVDKYVSNLNEERAKNNLKKLKYQPKLEQSASLRAQYMLKNDEFAKSGSNSGYPMKKAMSDVGYSNIVYGEFPMLGYYNADELFQAFLEQNGAKEFLLNPDYQEIGVSTFIGDFNGCPAQVVVQHLAGYVPPNYGQGEISSWREGLEKIKSIQPGWQKIKDYPDVYNPKKQEVDRINELISLRISRLEKIVSRMEKNEWLTQEEKKWIEEERALSKEQNDLAEVINNLKN